METKNVLGSHDGNDIHTIVNNQIICVFPFWLSLCVFVQGYVESNERKCFLLWYVLMVVCTIEMWHTVAQLLQNGQQIDQLVGFEVISCVFVFLGFCSDPV